MSRRQKAAKALVERVNRVIVEFDQGEQGTEYETGSSWDYTVLLERWERLMNGLVALDRAVHNPFGNASARVLATATALYELDFEVFYGLSHLGRALGASR